MSDFSLSALRKLAVDDPPEKPDEPADKPEADPDLLRTGVRNKPASALTPATATPAPAGGTPAPVSAPPSALTPAAPVPAATPAGALTPAKKTFSPEEAKERQELAENRTAQKPGFVENHAVGVGVAEGVGIGATAAASVPIKRFAVGATKFTGNVGSAIVDGSEILANNTKALAIRGRQGMTGALERSRVNLADAGRPPLQAPAAPTLQSRVYKSINSGVDRVKKVFTPGGTTEDAGLLRAGDKPAQPPAAKSTPTAATVGAEEVDQGVLNVNGPRGQAAPKTAPVADAEDAGLLRAGNRTSGRTFNSSIIPGVGQEQLERIGPAVRGVAEDVGAGAKNLMSNVAERAPSALRSAAGAIPGAVDVAGAAGGGFIAGKPMAQWATDIANDGPGAHPIVSALSPGFAAASVLSGKMTPAGTDMLAKNPGVSSALETGLHGARKAFNGLADVASGGMERRMDANGNPTGDASFYENSTLKPVQRGLAAVAKSEPNSWIGRHARAGMDQQRETANLYNHQNEKDRWADYALGTGDYASQGQPQSQPQAAGPRLPWRTAPAPQTSALSPRPNPAAVPRTAPARNR